MALVLGIIACRKEQNIIPNPGQTSITDMAFSVPNRILTDGQIDSIASWHNSFIFQATNNHSYDTSNFESVVYSVFDSIGVYHFGMSSSEVAIYLDSCASDNYAFLTNYTDDIDVINILDSVQSFVESNPLCNFSDIQSQVSTQTLFSNSYLTGSDLDIALVFLKTFEKSCYYWMPTNKGGLGHGPSFIDNIDDLPEVAINWGAIGYADGVGAASALLRTWYLAGFGPLSWGAIVGAIGWGAAFSSSLVLARELYFYLQ